MLPIHSGKPALRRPLPCGHDLWPSVGREPCQLGWYEWIARREAGKSMIDVGAGMGAGIAYLRYLGAGQVRGFDVDPRLMTMPDIVIGESPRESFGDKACDVVTCLDVIEHVVDDAVFLWRLKEVARETVYVTTPNLSRSGAGNTHHAREYTIAEFSNVFQPDELWVASPDGWYHRTQLLLKREGPGGVEIMQNQLIDEYYACGKIPLDVVFNHGSPDGQVWAHFCAVFRVTTP